MTRVITTSCQPSASRCSHHRPARAHGSRSSSPSSARLKKPSRTRRPSGWELAHDSCTQSARKFKHTEVCQGGESAQTVKGAVQPRAAYRSRYRGWLGLGNACRSSCWLRSRLQVTAKLSYLPQQPRQLTPECHIMATRNPGMRTLKSTQDTDLRRSQSDEQTWLVSFELQMNLEFEGPLSRDAHLKWPAHHAGAEAEGEDSRARVSYPLRH